MTQNSGPEDGYDSRKRKIVWDSDSYFDRQRGSTMDCSVLLESTSFHPHGSQRIWYVLFAAGFIDASSVARFSPFREHFWMVRDFPYG